MNGFEQRDIDSYRESLTESIKKISELAATPLIYFLMGTTVDADHDEVGLTDDEQEAWAGIVDGY